MMNLVFEMFVAMVMFLKLFVRYDRSSEDLVVIVWENGVDED